ncbi:Yip1 family protein [Chitinivorax sp. B]|uniref:Yip1 family protein n=1 Tax=Chitinivorax sp. B TaxID=2502235 RepID=UPI0010F828E1|nr:Yip1 family protein [Chitinivorax sp. B]
MKLSAYSRMITSFHVGWDELHRDPPSIISMMINLVLPFSLLPAAMILYAGHVNGQLYVPNASIDRWNTIALLFLVAELATVPLMAWVLRLIAESKQLQATYRDGFVVAAAAAIPLWLSSLVLLIPNPAINLIGVLLGLLASFAMLYHGLPEMFGTDEGIESLDLAYSSISAGGAAWTLLMAMVLLLLFGNT